MRDVSRARGVTAGAIAWTSRLFGVALVSLSLFVSLETVMRKAFDRSLQGADELGGYVLAVGSALAFIVALVERAHIRIDVLHRLLPLAWQATLDWLSAVSFALLGLFLAYVGWFVVADTLEYGSTAATPWATPLIWPQAVWYTALLGFAACAAVLAVRATRLWLTHRWSELADGFDPRGDRDAVVEELSNARGSD